MNVQSQAPLFGVNYDIGFVGFTARGGDFVSKGIGWFERWDTLNDITVEHTFIVTGPDECVEAHAQVGVQQSDLLKYFNDPTCHVFFRKPRGWTSRLGLDIELSAKTHIGDKYGYGVIVADALANTVFGHWLNKWTRNIPNRIVSRVLDRPGAEVCSELVADALQAQPSLAHRGCLREPARMITPQMLFVDNAVFVPWKNPSGHGPDVNPIPTPTYETANSDPKGAS